ncbi:hypothetical protein [Marinobacterium stanieri]|uniref:Uncharacterized protein n=1 Tax=Marinobacterium stanieri TaxID=49186 RepID=A0A1N6XL17_9GAMM|nr:hypothetical protein [Marinobacterium stanieri]SIR03012.1 hypothetical protein SAMN05421647_11484 [Marinobacterium stanieri]
MLWSDSLLIEGEHYPELVHQEEADKYERQAISLLIDVLDAEKSGDDKAIKQSAQLVSIYCWTSENLKAEFMPQAQAEIKAREDYRMEQAEKLARLTSTQESMTQSSAEFTFSFPAAAGVQACRQGASTLPLKCHTRRL